MATSFQGIITHLDETTATVQFSDGQTLRIPRSVVVDTPRLGATVQLACITADTPVDNALATRMLEHLLTT